ncbi:MAG: endonuclease MutS2 [Prevotella sp.]
MIYPKNFESKIGFDEIRSILKAHCLSTMGKELVDKAQASTDADEINEWLSQTREFRQLMDEHDNFPMSFFFDVRESVARIRLEGTHLEEDELFDLRRSMETIDRMVRFLRRTEGNGDEEPRYPYPALARMTHDVMTFPDIIRQIDRILDKFGHIKDNASDHLFSVRQELSRTEGSISRTLNNILRAAQSEGLVDKDVAPTMRDGRLVIPVAPALKKRIKGIVHDESATGKTVFVEPSEVVEANNKVRELEAEERREIVRILTDISAVIRPHVKEILASYVFLANIDYVHAKAETAKEMKAIEPKVGANPHIDWIEARHPLLQRSLEKQGKPIVPLEITLTSQKRILIISGPNAGGKSVCLKTVGLMQYMLQCGLSIPVSERSKTGVFRNIMIDIGDEQSIADDLSTYSSHLMNMKNMMRQANGSTLLLIDEFGGGTEPTIGGAIAESVLKQFCKKKAYGVITTHYQNLKHFADSHEGVVNGAMLYDRHEMRALFQLAIGQPGSSFAIEIARKTGIPEEVIADASEIVGSDYIQSDKYLQDIVRDKRYWEGKRQTVHQHEKTLEQKIATYERELQELERSRKEIIRKAKEQAEEIYREGNKRIENAIREIREQQAEKEATKRIREELKAFEESMIEAGGKSDTDELIARKMKQIQERRERKQKRKEEKQKQSGTQTATASASLTATVQKSAEQELERGDTVRIKGLSTVGKIETIDGKMATVIFGDMRTKMRLERLEHAKAVQVANKTDDRKEQLGYAVSQQTRSTIDSRKLNFKQDIDVRGMRADEAINAVMYFIDDAILVSMSRVRILHGTGTGALRQAIRQYLATVPNVSSFRDEHVQFGGAGITVVELN